jgi:hypothetical protein
MARTTKQLSGGGKDKFFRGLVASVEGLPVAAAAAVTARLIEDVTDVRVRRETWQAGAKGAVGVADAAAPAVAKSVKSEPVARSPVAKSPVAEPLAPPATAFDPFAFSAVAVFTRKGKAALVAELDSIARAIDLQALAAAQHLAVAIDLTDPIAIRAAIVVGTERRIAERKAAAS